MMVVIRNLRVEYGHCWAGIATRYVPDGPGIEYRWGARFSAPVQTGPGAYLASGSFLGVKRPGRGVDHPPPSSAEVEGWVELYIYSIFGLSWPVLGRTSWPLWCKANVWQYLNNAVEVPNDMSFAGIPLYSHQNYGGYWLVWWWESWLN